ncbi:MAG: hypothetical protein EOO89_33305, partial [Pedobacter sp.]
MLNPLNNTPVNYSYTDANPYSLGYSAGSNVLYRVRAITLDGASKISPIVSSSLAANTCGLPTTNTYCTGNPVISAPLSMLLCDGTQIVTVTGITAQNATWSSSDPSVFTVTSNGFSAGTKINPIAAGSATLTVYFPLCNLTRTATITVCACNTPGTPTDINANYTSSA